MHPEAFATLAGLYRAKKVVKETPCPSPPWDVNAQVGDCVRPRLPAVQGAEARQDPPGRHGGAAAQVGGGRAAGLQVRPVAARRRHKRMCLLCLGFDESLK